MKWLLIAALLVLIASFLWANRAWGKVIEGGPDSLANTRTLGDLIASDDSLHIIFVHGMRSEGAGNSKAFRKALLGRYPGSSQNEASRTLVDLGKMPLAKVGTTQVWRNEAEWQASRPFVDRYTLTLGKKTIIVDEINWWPLLFPIKCRMLLVPEHDLSGNDRKHLELCARSDKGYYPWITQAQLDDLLAERPRSGGGAWANRWGKREILNWGLSDAVIALGPLKTYLVEAMDKAFAMADAGAESILAEDRIVVSESLGSFVVLDAYRNPGGVQRYLDRTDHLYFFANQFALLELGRIELKRPKAGGPDLGPAIAPDPIGAPATPLEGLQQWARRPGPGFAPESATGVTPVGRESSPRQVIAFNDPSDLLTYDVPCMEDVAVVNLYVRNGTNWFGLFAGPIGAHTGHAGNKSVWKTMLRRSASAPEPLADTTCPR
jgi:hypothetical protein